MDQTVAPVVNGNPVPAEARVAGHFGELVQGRLGADGPMALVTLRCPLLASQARFTPSDGPLQVQGADVEKLRTAATALLDKLAPRGWGGILDVSRAAVPGTGAGSSTADILAGLRAVATAFGHPLTPEVEAELCREAEGAVDPLMYPDEVLFASREARVLRRLPALPACYVAGGFAGPGTATQPSDTAFPDMTHVIADMVTAFEAQDLPAIARLARVSAEANQDRNPNPFWGDVVATGGATGALGPVVAHTGSAIGLLYPQVTAAEAGAQALRDLGLARVVIFSTAG